MSNIKENTTLLEIQDLKVKFPSLRGEISAVRGVNLILKKGDSIAIVGESGSGKSVTSRTILGLIESPPAKISGKIYFKGQNILEASEKDWDKIRGKCISMIFQDSLDSLNPVYTIGSQISENLIVRLHYSKEKAYKETINLMKQVGIPVANQRINDYPNQFSGGMKQRVCIAMAISMHPELLLADEPTTALDVTVQAGILKLINRLKNESNMSLIFVTHDLSVAKKIADNLLVMYAGQIMEQGNIEDIFNSPRHPYTKALLNSHPATVSHWTELKPIQGRPPAKNELFSGCSFYPRCPISTDNCLVINPELRCIGEGHYCRCINCI